MLFEIVLLNLTKLRNCDKMFVATKLHRNGWQIGFRHGLRINAFLEKLFNFRKSSKPCLQRYFWMKRRQIILGCLWQQNCTEMVVDKYVAKIVSNMLFWKVNFFWKKLNAFCNSTWEWNADKLVCKDTF